MCVPNVHASVSERYHDTPSHACVYPIYIHQHLKHKVIAPNCAMWRLRTMWLTDWGQVTHLCVSHLTIIGSDNGLSPGRRQAIIWINDGILLIAPLGTKFSEILSKCIYFHPRRCICKCRLRNVGPFFSVSMCSFSQRFDGSGDYVSRCWQCELYSLEDESVTFESKHNNFHTVNYTWEFRL